MGRIHLRRAVGEPEAFGRIIRVVRSEARYEMATIPENLYRRLADRAQQHNQSVEEYLWSVLGEDEPQDQPAPMPDWEREMRRKLYKLARDYWREVGNPERLALTDDDLDEQFWLFDHEGIPRLKSEQGTIDLPPDPLEDLIGIVEDADPNLSMSVRETLEERFNAAETESSDAKRTA